MKFEISLVTNVGLVRSNNEDNLCVCNDLVNNTWMDNPGNQIMHSEQDSESPVLLLVADGMGGTNAGEVASKMVCDYIRNESQKKLSNTENIEHTLKQMLIEISQLIYQDGQRNSARSQMGTTGVIAYIDKSVVHFAWVGDSRGYLIRENNIFYRSNDHSYVQQLVDEGKITDEQAFFHPESNVITQCLGQREKVVPGYRKIFLEESDIVLLCTDGLCGMIQDFQILDTFYRNNQVSGSMVSLANDLINNALHAGGSDNVSVVLFKNKSNNNYNNLSDQSGSSIYRQTIGGAQNFQNQKIDENKLTEDTTAQPAKPKDKLLQIIFILMIALLFFALGVFRNNIIHLFDHNVKSDTLTMQPKVDNKEIKQKKSIKETKNELKKDSINKEKKDNENKNENIKKEKFTTEIRFSKDFDHKKMLVFIDSDHSKNIEKNQSITLSKGNHIIIIKDKETHEKKIINKSIQKDNQVINIEAPNFKKQPSTFEVNE